VLERGTIRITATRAAARLALRVENPCDPDRPRRTGSGVGLSNVRARLKAMHGVDAAVRTSEQNGTWTVEISFPTQLTVQLPAQSQESA
jgi:two-component system, LytTR family, sensor histidine kinase AlgZ